MAKFSTWPLCTALAHELVKELDLTYYDNPDRFDLAEVLQLLGRAKVQFGDGIPSAEESAACQTAPWKVNPGNPRRKDINDLLHHSMRVQMGTIPKTEFADFILSDADISTTGLMYVYLRELGIESKFCFGIQVGQSVSWLQPSSFLHFSPFFPQTFNSTLNCDGTPHCWLEIDGEPIQTSYVITNAPPAVAAKLKVPAFFYTRHKDLLLKENPATTERKVCFADDKFAAVASGGKRRIAMPKNLQIYVAYCSSDAGVEKHLVANLRVVKMNPSVKLYDVAMRDYIQRLHGKSIVSLEEKWQMRCWQCEKVAKHKDEFKSCGECMMAKYCGPQCQKKEWKTHKLLHAEIENYAGSVFFD
jgi:hypothetical protein